MSNVKQTPNNNPKTKDSKDLIMEIF